MSRADNSDTSPRAVIHKRILDVAASRPDAPLEAIADEVGGATVDLVERVLDEYGDPAETTDVGTENTPMKENGEAEHDQSTSVETDRPDPASLPSKQRETLRLVHGHPDWSQAEVAERLGVSRATVSRRLNDIPGFEWQERASFTQTVFDDDPGSDGVDTGTTTAKTGTASEQTEKTSSETDSDGDQRVDGDDDVDQRVDGENTGDGDALARVRRRLDRLETRVEDVDREAGEESAVSLPPALAHKVVHACMESDRVSEEEELRLLETLLDS